MKEKFRDKTRDNLNQDLNFIGVKAGLAERDHERESVENSWYQRSLGVINVAEGSIPWINILKQDGGKNNPPRWWMVFGIPDDRSSEIHPHTKIKTIRKTGSSGFPHFLRWAKPPALQAGRAYSLGLLPCGPPKN